MLFILAQQLNLVSGIHLKRFHLKINIRENGNVSLKLNPIFWNIKYFLQKVRAFFLWEWGPKRKITLNKEVDEIRLRDFWRNSSDPENVLYAAAFQNVCS